MSGPTWNRPKTQDRDVYVSKRTPATGVPAEQAWDDATGRYEGPELKAVRARRPTPERIARLEDKHDALELTVARMDSKVDTLVDFAAKADAAREKQAKEKAEAEEKAATASAAALERKRKYVLALIGALGVAIAAVVSALAVMR